MMKKLLAILMSGILALALTACGGEKPEEKADDGKTTIGVIAMESGEEGDSATMAKLEAAGIESVGYPTLETLLLALDSGKIESMGLPISISNYLVASNSDLVSVEQPLIHVYFKMAFRKADVELRKQIDDVIAKFLEDGTLKDLQEKYLVEDFANAAKVEMPKFDGAKTIKIGVTGAQPPLDFVAADGTPAGFNLALLAKIAEELKINIEVVVLENDARAISLTQEKIDGLFWFRSFGSAEAEDLDSVITTRSYHDEGGRLISKKK